MTLFVATLGAIVGVLIVGVVVWWFEDQRRRQEHERFRIMERQSRDPGCQAWSAWMAYHRTYGAQMFTTSDLEARLIEAAQTRLLRSVPDEAA